MPPSVVISTSRLSLGFVSATKSLERRLTTIGEDASRMANADGSAGLAARGASVFTRALPHQRARRAFVGLAVDAALGRLRLLRRSARGARGAPARATSPAPTRRSPRDTN